MNELIDEIERTRSSLQDLQHDRDIAKQQNDYGMAAVLEGEIKGVRAYLQGLRKAKELIDE